MGMGAATLPCPFLFGTLEENRAAVSRDDSLPCWVVFQTAKGSGIWMIFAERMPQGLLLLL